MYFMCLKMVKTVNSVVCILQLKKKKDVTNVPSLCVFPKLKSVVWESFKAL